MHLIPFKFADCFLTFVQAFVSEQDQMTTLLVGLETALYMTCRLKAYMDYLPGLPATQARTNFETSLTDFYALILKFLAGAIQIYQKNTLARGWNAFWKLEDVHSFENECVQIALRVETEASNCDRTLDALDRAGATQRKEDLQRALKELERLRAIQDSINKLETKIDLVKLPYANGAAFDSFQDELDARCLPETRVDLLQQINDWAQDPQGKCIFWLCGMAGTGKSTISRTVAQSFADKDQLGASFFFKRGEGDRGNASRFFTTITHQLVLQIRELTPYVQRAIEADPFISGKSLKEQFEKLIYQPLTNLMNFPTPASRLMIVVDALDECDREDNIKTILHLLSLTQCIRSGHVRIFLTSRPELPIRLGFRKMSADAHQDVHLHEVPQSTIHHDITVFLKNEFARIRYDENCDRPQDPSLSLDWPGDENIHALAQMATPLFIVAATICRFIGERRWDPKDQLAMVLRYQTTGQISQLEQLERTYLTVLDQLLIGLTNWQKEKLGQEFREIVGSIVILAEPLSTSALAELLHISNDKIKRRLDDLHSVLRIPQDHDSPVRLLHLSFGEFLLKNEICRERPFWVDEVATHEMLATKCLELLSGPHCLRENMCNLEYPGKPRSEIDSRIVDSCLPRHVQYACRYWVHHLEHGTARIHDQDPVHIFLQKHFLGWLEALSLMGKISESINFIGTLQSLVAVSWPLHEYPSSATHLC